MPNAPDIYPPHIVLSTSDVFTHFPLAVNLARYARLTAISECALWGVAFAGDAAGDCGRVWLKDERDMLLLALMQAQQMIEEQVSFPLAARWIGGSELEHETDEQRYRPIMFTRYSYVNEIGARVATRFAHDAVVNHVADPAVVGPIAAPNVASIEEVHVYHPDTQVEIYPSAITLAGGNVTLTIPRCRMVKSSLFDNPSTGLDYTDVNNFEAAVDVWRVYNDPSHAATLVWTHSCSTHCYVNGCAAYTETACLIIRKHKLGVVHLVPARYISGAWHTDVSYCHGGRPAVARLEYRAGLRDTHPTLDNAVIRLAHTLLPNKPCGCESINALWERDRAVSITGGLESDRLRAANPFGASDGAYFAWKAIQPFAVKRGSVLI